MGDWWILDDLLILPKTNWCVSTLYFIKLVKEITIAIMIGVTCIEECLPKPTYHQKLPQLMTTLLF